MEVLALLAKHELQAALEEMLGRAAEDQHVPTVPRPRQQQRRLGPKQVAEVVARYIDGESIDGLAREYGINRTTVISHLKRQGVDRRKNPRKMTDANVQAATASCGSGRSIAEVAVEFDICERTLRREFARAGVRVASMPGVKD